MHDRILVPTDGSAGNERALEYAFDLARIHEATIRALYVVNLTSYGGLPMEAALEGIDGTLREEGENVVGRVEALAPDDVEVETVVLQGAPTRVIVEQTTRGDCDLVVMGTHGRDGIDRLLLGSVTERVVRNAPVPVLAVQLDPATDDERPDRREVAVE